MKKESIEGIFNQEIREKRIAAHGARNKVTGVKKNGCFPHETLKGQALKDYKGNSPAALALNCSDGSISRVCSGKQKQTKGMVFKYADDDRR